MANGGRTIRLSTLILFAALTAACSGSDEEAATTQTPPSGNSPPTIAGTPALTIQVGTPYSFIPTAGDANNDPLVFSILSPPAWATFSTTTGELAGTPTVTGTFSNIRISVSDGTATANLPAFTVTVTSTAPPPPPPNSAPTISGNPPTSVQTGTLYTFTPIANDADNDSLTFSILNAPGWAAFNQTTGQLQGTPTAAGTHSNIRISVSDGTATANLPAFTITVTATPPPPPPPNAPPTISGTPLPTGQVGTQYTFTPTASDPNPGDTLTFLISNRPNWLVFTPSTGRIQGTPTAAGTYSNITIRVTDGTATTSLPAFTITVAPAPNVPPTISGTPSPTGQVGTQYTFTPTASDPNTGDTLTFSILGQPGWLNFTPSTGRIQGTPTTAGTYSNIRISVSDGTATANLPAFTITVAPAPNAPPTISGTPSPTGQVGTQYTFTPTASDPNTGDTLTFSILGQPGWLNFNTSTGQVQGTPTAAGTYSNIRISVSDGTATANLPAFTITVSAAPNAPPTISGTPSPTGQVGTQYTFTPTASDPNTGDTLTFSILGQPGWLNFTSSTGRIQGTPTAAGTYSNIRISVSDGTATANLPAFTITVAPAPNAPPTISGTPPATGQVGTQYTFTPTASDPNTGDTLTFSILGQPGWLNFNTSTGQLQGTPTAGDVGAYANIRISVSDGTATANLPAFTITVMAVGTGSATLTWTAPTQNEDGSPLTDLTSYRIYWGTTSRNYTNSVTLTNPGLTTYVVGNLLSGTTYYFATAAGNSQGLYSAYSNEATRTVP